MLRGRRSDGDAIDLDWVLSTPVEVNVGKAGGTAKTVTVTPTAVPKSNGTKACDAARAKIVYANSEIRRVVNNLNFANKLNDNASV